VRIIVCQIGKSWQATARIDAFFEVGDFKATPEEAMQDAITKLRKAIPVYKPRLNLKDLL
jgi:hypothetical protein